jgi:dTDP-4-amino-4,6-dideoxygalactose transaminase/acetyltransferase-like isoleucine patch superfamily enzyme
VSAPGAGSGDGEPPHGRDASATGRRAGVHPEARVHPTAIIDDGATVGPHTRIWHFVHVSAGARIGARCSLGQNVFVGAHVPIGDGVKIQNNVSVYEGVEIEDDVFLGPSCVFTNVLNPRAFVDRKAEYRPTRVRRGATIGANAVIVCGHDIGVFAFVGAGSVVTRDVAPYALVVGNPARRIGWMCRCGARLPEVPVSASFPATCPACGARYRIEGEVCMPYSDPPSASRSSETESGSAASSERAPAEAVASSAERDAAPRPNDGSVPLLDLVAQNYPLMPELRAAFERVVSHGGFILGKEVESFETAIAVELGVAHAIGVSSGTDAILVALMALGVGPGDEVITTPFSFFATAGCVARLGARPVFVDIDPVTYNLDVALVAAVLTDRTRAILPVHLFGQPCDMRALQEVARARGLPIIEDAAQAIGATTTLGPVGKLGAVGCFSFFPSKNLGAFGDGGLCTTEDPDLAERLRVLRVHGGKPKYHHAAIGGNFRLDALQAAILSVKLPHLRRWAQGRARNAARYTELFTEAKRRHGLDDAVLGLPVAREPGHVWNQYVIRSTRRDALRKHLTDRRIGTEVYYPVPLHRQPCFADLGHPEGSFPEAERAAREVLALPVFPELGEGRLEVVVREVVSFLTR